MNSSGAALETRHSNPVVDWRSGRIRSDSPHESRSAPTWSLILCGDWAPEGHFFEKAPANPHDVYGDLLPVLQEADPVFFDLECVIADRALESAVKDGSFGKAPYWVIQPLTDWEVF